MTDPNLSEALPRLKKEVARGRLDDPAMADFDGKVSVRWRDLEVALEALRDRETAFTKIGLVVICAFAWGYFAGLIGVTP